MAVLAFVLLAQLGAPLRAITPVLAFPESGLDDTVAYRGYQTRFYRDASGNTIQIYLDGHAGRVVHLWADSQDESLGFTARDTSGRPLSLRWNSVGAAVSRSSRQRTLEHSLVADAPVVHLGGFLLGSMRVERDFQYGGRQGAPFREPPYALPEIARLLAALGRLDPTERTRHLAALGAHDEAVLRTRLRPTMRTVSRRTIWVARLTQLSLDGRDSLSLEVRTDPRHVAAIASGDSISLQARSGDRVAFSVRIATSARPLVPLTREEIFRPEFLAFLTAARAVGPPAPGVDATGVRARRLERQVRGMELLASREKLMAGLPNYATYFGRDMLVTTLMMRPIWREAMSEFVIASVLRKLSPSGQVSHEEALGGQAAREAAAEYAALIDESFRAAEAGRGGEAASLRARARAVLRDDRRVRENYHMIDAEFQFPVLVAAWLTDTAVSSTRKRAFLLDSADNREPRVARLLRELALVARVTAPYADQPTTDNLVSFPMRDSVGWASASWRDSNAGYAGGRYALDVNAIWGPAALEAVGRIIRVLRTIGLPADSVARVTAELSDTPLARYSADSAALGHAVHTWRGAVDHFLVRLGPVEVKARTAERLAAMSPVERAHWTAVLAASQADEDSLSFLALSLDGRGQPIGVANSDPATRLFLDARDRPTRAADGTTAAEVLRDVRLFVRPYPVGLFVDGVGPVVANDAYAPPSVWRDFDRDRYHGPRVVWGREVNLFLLGVLGQLARATETTDGGPSPPRTSSVASFETELRNAAARVLEAVEASGFHSELWSYDVVNGRAIAIRYGTGSDVQLWSTTDLAVRFALSRRGQ